MKRPLSITVIGWVFLLLGILAAIEIILAFAEHRISLNYGVFLGFVGYGLLKLKASSRRWAIRWAIFGYAFFFLLLVLLLSGQTKLNGQPVTEFSQYAAGVLLIVGFYALMGWAHSILRQPDIISLFEGRDGREPSSPSNFIVVEGADSSDE